MKVLAVCGNTKANGTTNKMIEMFEQKLNEKYIGFERIDLRKLDFGDCKGCHNCIREGDCVIRDDLDMVKMKMQEADGLLLSSPVRDNYPTALFKKFYERLSYPFGFTPKLKGKPVVAVSTVGVMGGKKTCRTFIGLKPFLVKDVGFVYEKVGSDKRFRNLEKMNKKMDVVLDKLIKSMETPGSGKKRIFPSLKIFKFFVHLNRRHMPYVYKEWFGREAK